MIREIVFDTETTGLDPQKGDRIVELGAIELIDLMPTGRTFHVYINPERDVPDEVVRVHGLTNEFLADKPVFADPSVADAFLRFVGSDNLVAHNAEFDRKFINAELKTLGLPTFEQSRFIDTLTIARKKFPSAPNSLDALCRRFGVDIRHREKHGALLDSYLLAEVYLQLSGGRERRLDIFTETDPMTAAPEAQVAITHRRARPTPLKPLSTEQERLAHRAFVSSLAKTTLWAKWLEPSLAIAD
jgi:DNA polymerase-3 subunit epsilon